MKTKVFRRLLTPVLIAAAFIFTFSVAASAQNPAVEKSEYAGEIPTLVGLTEAFLVNAQPALRILTRKSGAAEVRFAKRDGEDALVFLVFKLKSFGMGLQNDSEGKLYITREKIVYEPNTDRRSFFSAKRAEIKGVDLKKNGQGFDTALFELGGEKMRFVMSGIMVLNRQDSKPSIAFLYHAIINFEAALKIFNELTASVRQQPDDYEDEPDEEPSTEISDKYDRFKDITIVSTSRMLVRGPRRSIRAQVQYSFPGSAQKAPEKFTLALYVSGASPVLNEDDLALNFLVDGKRVPLGDMKLSEEKAKSVVKQTLTVAVSYETFKKITEGKKVEFQIGSLEYSLTDIHLEALKNLLSYKKGE